MPDRVLPCVRVWNAPTLVKSCGPANPARQALSSTFVVIDGGVPRMVQKLKRGRCNMLRADPESQFWAYGTPLA
jgi:hypothetical protein